jgi:hypothetical protein
MTLVVEAVISRVGVNWYEGDYRQKVTQQCLAEALGGSTECLKPGLFPILRPADELSRSVDDWVGVPVFRSHQDERAIGYIGSDAALVDGLLRASLIIWDPEAISRITQGPVYLSAGYNWGITATPGEFDGRSYAGAMRNIRPQHVAFCPPGRIGRAGRLCHIPQVKEK